MTTNHKTFSLFPASYYPFPSPFTFITFNDGVIEFRRVKGRGGGGGGGGGLGQCWSCLGDVRGSE